VVTHEDEEIMQNYRGGETTAKKASRTETVVNRVMGTKGEHLLASGNDGRRLLLLFIIIGNRNRGGSFGASGGFGAGGGGLGLRGGDSGRKVIV
jgi:hypothetical protein